MDDPWNGARLRDLRLRKMLTQEELAQRMGRHWQTIQRWEKGYATPRVPMRRALCDALGVTAEELYGTE